MSKRYCILGGGGSFGLHTSRYLLEHADAESVVAIGRAPAKPRCFTLGVGENDPRYSYRVRHITYDFASLIHLLDKKKPHVIINFAAQGESGASFKESWRYFETNCLGLSRLVETLQTRDYLERFVHIGASESYGSADHPVREDEPLMPTSPYAVSKAAFDQHLMVIHKRNGFPMNIVRPSNAYGEGQQLHRFIPKAFLCGLTGRKMPLNGGGTGEKSYIHNQDLARAIHLVTERAPLGSIYNIAPHRTISMRAIGQMIATLLGKDMSDMFMETPNRRGTDARYWFDPAAAAIELDWRQEIFWEDGLDRMLRWVRQYLDDLRKLPTEFVMRA